LDTGLNKRGFRREKLMNKKRYLIAGIVVAVVGLSILSYTMLAGHRPVIASLVAEPERVPPRGSCQIVCNATDPDGYELSYNWSASGGKITGEGATVTWTAPSSVGSYNVTVTVSDSHGAEAKGYRTITVNNPPTITSLIANASWTTPSGTIQVTCTASDPDHDELSYEWTTDVGSISGTGAVVNWTAPQEVGAYNVTVVVKDSYGGEDTKFVHLFVNLGTPPTIEKLVVIPNGNKYLRKSSTPGCNFDVYQSKEYAIECVASNASGELFYDWSCTGGEISGEGSNITWTAPSTSSSFKVTVTISDTAGDSMSENIVFWVSSCTCGSWPLKSGEVLF
jgi:hypothetical protein